MTPTILWLIAGAVFIGIEIFGIPGIGFLFAGIGAIIVGGGIEFGMIPDDTLTQFIVFFVFACGSALALWKRLKQKKGDHYSNVVGTEATVAAGGLSGSKVGQVQWSGTLMRARLNEGVAVDVLPEGAVVIVKRIEGNLLYVAPKH